MFSNLLKILSKYGHVFLKGTWGTLYLSLIVVFFGTIFGAILALMKMNNKKLLPLISNIFVELVRGTPILLQLYLFYYLGANLISSQLPDTFWVITALIVNSSAYVSEIFRAGIGAVDKGQFEAAKSLGLSNKQMMKHIIFPQAIKNILPALGNEFITLMKESAIISVVGMRDIMFNAQVVAGATYMPFLPYLLAAAFYFVLTTIASKLLGIFERRLKQSD